MNVLQVMREDNGKTEEKDVSDMTCSMIVNHNQLWVLRHQPLLPVCLLALLLCQPIDQLFHKDIQTVRNASWSVTISCVNIANQVSNSTI